MLSGVMPAGGLAVFHIRLLPTWGAPRSGTLEVNCALAKVPYERRTEGIRLIFEGSGKEFDEEISGRALFMLMNPGARAGAEVPGARVDQDVPQPEPNR